MNRLILRLSRTTSINSARNRRPSFFAPRRAGDRVEFHRPPSSSPSNVHEADSFAVQGDILDEVDSRLRQYIGEYGEEYGAEVRDESSLAEIGFDSLMGIELVVYIEDRFGIRFTDEEAVGVRTYRDMKVLTYKYYVADRMHHIVRASSSNVLSI